MVPRGATAKLIQSRSAMKIVMMGSGGVGGYFGARLAAGGADVRFVARGSHLAAMRAQGLTIEGGPAPLHLSNVQATDDPSSIGMADFVMIAVKLWDTDAAIKQVKPIVGPNTTVISFQNGVLKDRYLLKAFGASRIGVGLVAGLTFAADKPVKGKIKSYSAEKMTLVVSVGKKDAAVD
jgi:2-dehydropantoate 2-reductase